MAINTLAIVQARFGSVRFPGKILKEVNGFPLIQILFHRLSQSKKIDKIILATSKNIENDSLAILINNLGYDVFRGNELDVLDRYYNAAEKFKAETIVRITGDCPIIDPHIVDRVISIYDKGNVDYVSNTLVPTYPDGLDVEVFSFRALKMAQTKAKKPFDREHVTPFIKSNDQFIRKNVENNVDLLVIEVTNVFSPLTDPDVKRL